MESRVVQGSTEQPSLCKEVSKQSGYRLQSNAAALYDTYKDLEHDKTSEGSRPAWPLTSDTRQLPHWQMERFVISRVVINVPYSFAVIATITVVFCDLDVDGHSYVCHMYNMFLSFTADEVLVCASKPIYHPLGHSDTHKLIGLTLSCIDDDKSNRIEPVQEIGYHDTHQFTVFSGQDTYSIGGQVVLFSDRSDAQMTLGCSCD